MLAVMVDCVIRLQQSRGLAWILSSVQIAVKTRKIAAGNFQPQLMTGQEDIAGSPEIDGELINLSRVHEFGFCLGTSVAHPENAVRQVLGKSIGPDIDQLGRKVSIHG